MRHCSFYPPVVLLVFFFISRSYAQPAHVPGYLIQHLRQHCSICQQRPADTALLITENTDQYKVSFHNSLVALQQNYLDEAYTYSLQTIAAQESKQSADLYQYAYFIKAKVLYYKHLYRESIAQYQALLKDHAKDSMIISTIYSNIGEAYLEQGKYNEALQYFTDWQRLFLAGADFVSSKNYYHNRALCLFHLGKFKESEELFFKNIALEQQNADSLGLAISYMNLANVYYNQYLDAKAIPYFQKSLLCAQKGGDLTVLKNAYLNAAVVDENRKMYPSAIAYRKQYERLQDSIWNRDQVWKLAAQERKFSTQLNESKIKLLQQEARLREVDLKTRSRQRNTLLVAAALFLAVAGFVYYAYRSKVKASRIITKQKEELALLNAMKDRLFSIVAHDLRSPVHAIKTNVEGIQVALSDDKTTEAKVLTDRVNRTAINTWNLLDNMLHWALSQTNQLFFRPEKLHLATIINQVSYDYAPLADAKSISLHKEVPAAIFIQADLTSLRIVLRNLLDNAIKYTPANSEITITASIEAQQCCILVKDTGIGMDQRLLEAVMNRNGQQIREDTQGNRSTGFGLELCRMMMERNQGTLAISSSKAGTTVTICLPLL
jgi:signal transduction histidine kinase